MKAEIDVLKNKLENEQSIVADQERRISQMDNEIVKLRNEVKVSRQQLENSQVISDKLRDNLESELITVKEQLSASLKKEQQLFTKSMSLESELEDKSNRVHNVNLQNGQLQTNNNNMLQMLESYEVKVSGLNKKIKKFETEIKEILSERD